MKITDIREVETLDLKASILLLLNALEILAALLGIHLESGHEAVACVALAPRLTAAQERDDDLAPHADDSLADADAAALHGLGVGEPHEGCAGGDFVRVGGVVRCHAFNVSRHAWNTRDFFVLLKLVEASIVPSRLPYQVWLAISSMVGTLPAGSSCRARPLPYRVWLDPRACKCLISRDLGGPGPRNILIFNALRGEYL